MRLTDKEIIKALVNEREILAGKICKATQKTNYACTDCGKRNGNCAYCGVMSDELLSNGVIVNKEEAVQALKKRAVIK